MFCHITMNQPTNYRKNAESFLIIYTKAKLWSTFMLINLIRKRQNLHNSFLQNSKQLLAKQDEEECLITVISLLLLSTLCLSLNIFFIKEFVIRWNEIHCAGLNEKFHAINIKKIFFSWDKATEKIKICSTIKNEGFLYFCTF